MADGERRMLFDLRGRRRHVIRVVYGILALLMAGSLLLVVGPFSIGELVGSGGSSDAVKIFHEQSERIEGRLAKDPTDEGLLLSLTRARINAGNAGAEVDPQTGTPVSFPPESQADFDEALAAWNRYLKQAADSASPSAAQLVAITYFGLAERGSATVSDVEENLVAAVRAQRIAAAARPNAGSLSNLAIYEYFNGNFAAGDKAARRATALASSKPEKENAEKQLAAYRKRAKSYVTQSEKIAKAQQKSGAEQLQNPFGFGAP
jgi:hypothetical protein